MLLLLCTLPAAASAEGEDELLTVLVGFDSREQERAFTRRSKRSNSNSIEYEYELANAVRMKVTRQEYEGMQKDKQISYIQEDPIVYHVSSNRHGDANANANATGNANLRSLQEQVSYGLSRVQGDLDIPPSPDASNCQVTVCIIDSGLVIDHYDIPYELDDGYIEGAEFGIPSDQYWYNPKWTTDHGTAVVGIMAAQGGNRVGTAGILPNGPQDSKVCLRIARIFPDDKYTTTSGTVLQAAEWCSAQGSNIINLSIAAERFTFTDASVYRELQLQGILLVAAAGNWGTEAYSFPASFDSVVSVGSVDRLLRVSSFSQVNDQVELVAPGSNIVSTAGIGMDEFSGTSFATPYVSGIAAKLWAANPYCDAYQIRKALTESAMMPNNNNNNNNQDVPNDEFGYGIVQALDAHEYIFDTIETPCGGQAPSATPSLAPTLAPSALPSLVPSNAPTTTYLPSNLPSMSPTKCQEFLQVCVDNECCGDLICQTMVGDNNSDNNNSNNNGTKACRSGAAGMVQRGVVLLLLLATTLPLFL